MTDTPSTKALSSEKSSVGFISWFTAMRRNLPGYYGPIFGFSLAINILRLKRKFRSVSLITLKPSKMATAVLQMI